MNVLIVGGGQPVYFMSRALLGKGHRVTIVNHDQVESQWLARRQENAVVVLGDGSNPRVLSEAGCAKMDVVLAVTAHDADNLVVCQAAREMFGVERTLALVNDPELEGVFHTLGVEGAFSMTHILAGIIERRVEYSHILSELPLGEGDISLTEIDVAEEAPAAGRAIRDLDLPEDHLVAFVIRGGDPLIPLGHTVLRPGDRLFVIGHAQGYEDAVRTLTGKAPS